MQQRLGLAQALIGSPRLLLLDEPTSALDPAGRRTVRDLLGELRGRGVSVLLNTHLLSEVEHTCDRVLILHHGEVLADGSPAELTRPRGVEVELASGHTHLRGRGARGRAADRRRAGRRGRAGLLGRAPAVDARGALPGGAWRDPRRAPRAARVAAAADLRGRAGDQRRCSAALYAFGAHELFKDVSGFADDKSGLDAKTLAGATILGLAMFGSLFLGAVLAVFLTAGAVRGDAETGTLQPLIVRPLSRRALPRRPAAGRVGRERRLRRVRLPRARSC